MCGCGCRPTDACLCHWGGRLPCSAPVCGVRRRGKLDLDLGARTEPAFLLDQLRRGAYRGVAGASESCFACALLVPVLAVRRPSPIDMRYGTKGRQPGEKEEVEGPPVLLSWA
jgi:hypothetical protein